MSAVYHRLVDFVASAPLVDRCPADSEFGAWFLTPQQHLIEFVAINGAFAYLAYLAYQLYYAPSSASPAVQRKPTKQPTEAGQQRRALVSEPPSTASWLLNHVLVFLLSLSYAMMVIHKSREDRLWFLLQPCHVLHLLLLRIITMPPSSTTAIFLFNLYLHLLFSPFLGLVAADLTCYTQPYELANWCLQHLLLLAIPLLFLLPPSRFPLVTGRAFFFLCFSIEVLYHSLLLYPAALLTGYNLNYVLCPPAGTVLEKLGPWYRVAMTGFCGVLSAVVRYGAVEGWRWAVEKGLGDGKGPDVVEMKVEDDGGQQGKKKVVMEEEEHDEEQDADEHESKAGVRRRGQKAAQ